jgi:nitrogen fixation protein FixH
MTPLTPAAANPHARRTPGGLPRWALIVLGLLAAHVLGMATMIFIATRQPVGVIPGYYRQALDWDSLQAERRAAAKLGWQVAIVPATTVDAAGRRAVSFHIADAQGGPVTGAEVSLVYYPLAHPERAATVKALEQTPGEYRALLPAPAGRWCFDIRAVTPEARFVAGAESYFSDVPR